MRWRRRAAAALLVLAAVALAACGGDDGGGDDAETAAIRDAAERIMTSRDEVVACGELMTASFVRRIYGDRRRCRRAERVDAGNRPPTDAMASVLRRGGSVATVRVGLIGGDSDGAAGTISMRKVSGEWRLDAIRPDLVDAVLASGLRASYGDDLPQAAIDCVRRRVRSSIGAGEELLRVTASTRDRAVDTVLGAMFACRPGEVRELFESKVREASGDRLPEDLTDCILRRLRSAVSENEFLMFLRDSATVKRATVRATRACAARRADAAPTTTAS